MTALVLAVMAGSIWPRIDQVGPGVAVDQDRPGADGADRQGGGDVGVGREDDLVAGLDAERGQGQPEGVEAGADPDGVGHPGQLGEGPLELAHLGAEDETGSLQHLLDGGQHLGPDRALLGGGVEERHPHGRRAHGATS